MHNCVQTHKNKKLFAHVIIEVTPPTFVSYLKLRESINCTMYPVYKQSNALPVTLHQRSSKIIWTIQLIAIKTTYS